MNTIALHTGWAVVVGVTVLIISGLWKAAGNPVWTKVVPDHWKESGRRWPREGSIVAPSLLVVMFLCDGPASPLRLPSIARVQIRKRAVEKKGRSRVEGAAHVG